MKATKTMKREKQQNGNFFLSLLKGALMALSISLIAICIFAFVLRFIDISSDFIKPINQVIKIVSILIGTLYGLKGIKDMGLIRGFSIGIVYVILSFIVFSILNGGFSIDSSIVNDLIFGGVAGAISGIIAVNLRKK